MSTVDQVEPLSLVPNRLAIIPFTPDEIDTIMGGNEYEMRLLSSNFNWIAAYLCEEAGIFESQMADWFRTEAADLDHESPLAIWRSKEGFWRVFEHAQRFKERVDKERTDGDSRDPNVPRSHEIGKNALSVILKSFEAAGVDISACGEDPDYTRSRAIHNPHKNNSPVVSWRGNTRMEDYRITLDEGSRQATFFIVRYLPEDEEPAILQTGIGRYGRMLGENQAIDIDTDLDGRPPSAGEVASFVIPVANETQNRSLKPIAA